MRWTTPAIVSVLYLALAGSVIAFWLNYWLLKRIGATKLLAMSLVEPLIAVVLGAIVLREALPAGTLLGGACILASTWMVLAPQRSGRAGVTHGREQAGCIGRFGFRSCPLPFAKHRHRVETGGATGWHPRREGPHGNEHRRRAGERDRIPAGLQAGTTAPR